MPKQKRTFMAHYTFTINVPIEAASLEVAYRRSGRLAVDDAYECAASFNYHHWKVEDPDTGVTISSADTTATEATEDAKECDA